MRLRAEWPQVYLVPNPKNAQALASELRVEPIDAAWLGGADADEPYLEASVGAVVLLIADRLATGATDLVVIFAADVAVKVLGAVLNALGPSVLLVIRADSPHAALVDFETPALMLGEESVQGQALSRLARIRARPGSVTPTATEHAMAAASIAARRSAAPRGGVGACLIDELGEVLLLGTAEVPRFKGGHYWSESADDARDHASDPATKVRLATVKRLLTLLEYKETGAVSLDEVAAQLLIDFDRSDNARDVGTGDLASTFESLGRVVHAEMAVLCHAARRGQAVKGLTMCATASPCRQCLRHAVCSGIERIVYLGRRVSSPPDFLADSVSTEPNAQRMALVAFEGIAPGAYELVFGKPPKTSSGAYRPLPATTHFLSLARQAAEADVGLWARALGATPQTAALLHTIASSLARDRHHLGPT